MDGYRGFEAQTAPYLEITVSPCALESRFGTRESANRALVVL